MPTVRLDNVSKFYRTKERRTTAAITDVSLEIEQGEFIFLVGSRGAGKSTLLDIISGELVPDRGAVYLDEVNMARMNKKKLRSTMGRVPQESALVRTETIAKNFIPPKRFKFSREDPAAAARVSKALGLVGLAGCEDRFPLEFSLSDCKKIELAKAIMGSPAILLLDGMTERVDDDTVWDMMHLLGEMNKRGTTVIMVTNSSQIVNIMRKRVVTLADGKIVGDVRKGKYGYIM